jgi:hypothetical protein
MGGYGSGGYGAGGYGAGGLLPNLLLPPDQNSYTIVLGNTVLSTTLEGGASRFRADKLGAVHTVTVQWTCNAKNYAYLMAFFRASINFGADPFQTALIIDSGQLLSYTCHIVPGTFGLTSQRGQTYVVGATLEVAPNPAYYATDADTVAAGPDV